MTRSNTVWTSGNGPRQVEATNFEEKFGVILGVTAMGRLWARRRKAAAVGVSA